MLSQLKSIVKHMRWWFSASNSKGHGMHSPFVFNFIINVLNDDRMFYAFRDIEAQTSPFNEETKKVNQLLFKMVDYYQLNHIVEIDASIGVTTKYLAYANSNARIISLEESQDNIDFGEWLELKGDENVKVYAGSYETSLPATIQQLQSLDFVVMNRCSANTIQHFNQIISSVHNNSFVIIKSIYSNDDAEKSWNEIKAKDIVRATIDLFDLGIVLFNPDFKVKQHFKVRF